MLIHKGTLCCRKRGGWASLVAQTVKNPPAMRETWVRSLGWEESLEEGMATHSSILACSSAGLPEHYKRGSGA